MAYNFGNANRKSCATVHYASNNLIQMRGVNISRVGTIFLPSL